MGCVSGGSTNVHRRKKHNGKIFLSPSEKLIPLGCKLTQSVEGKKRVTMRLQSVKPTGRRMKELSQKKNGRLNLALSNTTLELQL